MTTNTRDLYAHTFYGNRAELQQHMKNLGDRFSYEEQPGISTSEDSEWRIGRKSGDYATHGPVVVALRLDGTVPTLPQHVPGVSAMEVDEWEEFLASERWKASLKATQELRNDSDGAEWPGWRVTDLGPIPEVFDALHPPKKPANRYQTNADLAAEFAETLDTKDIAEVARPDPKTPKPQNPFKINDKIKLNSKVSL